MGIISDLIKQNEILKQEISNIKNRINYYDSIEDKNRVIYKLLNKQNEFNENERIIIAFKEFIKQTNI